MKIRNHDLAVCSWSLQPQGMADLVEKVRQLEFSHVQLALIDLVLLDDKRKHAELGHLRASGLKLTGGMFAFPGEDYATIERIRQTGGYVPDADWAFRKRLSIEAAKLAADLGIGMVATHIGFVPPRGQPGYDEILARVIELAETLAAHDISLLMETGQEPADELLEFLDQVAQPNVGINFDPANMILYGSGDPIEAIGVLGRHIRHVHVKDATPSTRPGQDWGEEVHFGAGKVDPKRFLDALDNIGYAGPLAIEREAGTNRMVDVKQAIDVLKNA